MAFELEELTETIDKDDVNLPRLEYDCREDYQVEEDIEDEFLIVEEE